MSYWSDVQDHWKSQFKRHETSYEVAGMVAATAVGAGGLVPAYLAVKQANATQQQIEAVEAAKKSLAQTPLSTDASVRSSLGVPNIGATGSLQFSEGVKAYIPLALGFLVVMYLIFKD